MTRLIFTLAAAIWLAGATAEAAAPAQATTGHARVELFAEHAVAAAGDGTWLALRLTLDDGWHTYWKNPGDSGEATRLEWSVPDGVEPGEIVWPAPERIPFGPFVNFGFHGAPVHLVKLNIADDWPVGQPLRVEVLANWLVCEEICIPEEATLGLELEVARVAQSAAEPVAGIFAAARAATPVALPLSGAFTVADGALQIELARGDIAAAAETLFFFPDQWGWIEPSTPQTWSYRGQKLVGRMAPGPAPPAGEFAGVAVYTAIQSGERRAVRISAVDIGAAVAETPQAATTPMSVWQALVFAILGGLILNLMPCVLPVLSIKALSLVAHGGTRSELRRSGIAYTAGVLGCFALLGLILVGLRSAGEAAGWGFQLQSPGFVAAMSYMLFAMALVLSLGLDPGAGLAGAGDGLTRRGGLSGSFFTGALAAVVATPCTAPFMAAAIGFALIQPAAVAMTIMLALGFGLALPFVLLTFVPAWTRWLPRPGAWMSRLKQGLAFPLYATVVWLLWVAGQQVGIDGLVRLLFGLLLLALALWLYSVWRREVGAARQVATVVSIAALGAALVLGVTSVRKAEPAVRVADSSSVPFAEDDIAAIRASGRAVFVNMTAAWCITCLVNERVALDTRAVRDALSARDVVYMKGDWTNRDAAITRYLASFGRAGVPLYVLYPPGDGAPRVLPQILTESSLLEALGALDQYGEAT